MNLLEEIFTHEVLPAIGCTEPISCAYAAGVAAEHLEAPIESMELLVDTATFKNGAAVTVPCSGGRKGNVIGAALGAFIASSARKLEVLKDATPETLKKATDLIENGGVKYGCKEGEKDFHVEVLVWGGGSSVRCVISGGHTHIICLEKDGRAIIGPNPDARSDSKGYREILKNMKIKEVLREVIRLDDESRAYIQRGVEMNMAMLGRGMDVKKTAYQLQRMKEAGIVAEDLFYRVKLRVASAVDARMGGIPEPVMTSGGSGNQGVVAILVPHLVGVDQGIESARIQESIAISHALNAYIKCFIGEMSVICGCAIAAGISAAAAVVYQQAGIEMEKIGFAINNVIGDLGGLICDGAKPGCSMKAVSATETAIRSAFMALGGYGLSAYEGLLGISPENTIRNLSRVTLEGMFGVDPTIVKILKNKTAGWGRA